MIAGRDSDVPIGSQAPWAIPASSCCPGDFIRVWRSPTCLWISATVETTDIDNSGMSLWPQKMENAPNF